LSFVGGTSGFVNAFGPIWYTTTNLELADLFIEATRDIGTNHGPARGNIPFTIAFCASLRVTLTLGVGSTWLPDFATSAR